jgi:hypothetical protein
MPKRSGGDPSWWSSGSVPDALPGWARRGLDEAPDDLAPSPPPADTGRHRPSRRRGAAGASAGSSKLRGWGLAAASVAAAAAAVPLAVSTLVNSGENTALPRVGTFPVVAPGTLPGTEAPSAGSRGPREPADASVLPPLDGPVAAAPVVPAQPPRTVTVAPRAVARDADETSTRRTPTRTTRSTADDDETSSTTRPTTRGDDGGDGGAGGGSGGSGGGNGGSGGGSGGGGGDGGSGGGNGGGGNGGGGLLGGVGNAVGGTVRGATGAVGSLLN